MNNLEFKFLIQKQYNSIEKTESLKKNKLIFQNLIKYIFLTQIYFCIPEIFKKKFQTDF